MKYQVQVCMTYIHVVEVEADTQESAEQQAFDAFDLSKAHQCEGECWTINTEETV